jgi:chromosome condensin MukBEF complex kleisin-like MukF subunit
MSKEVATTFKELGDRLEVKGQVLEEKLLPYKQCILQHKDDEKKLVCNKKIQNL